MFLRFKTEKEMHSEYGSLWWQRPPGWLKGEECLYGAIIPTVTYPLTVTMYTEHEESSIITMYNLHGRHSVAVARWMITDQPLPLEERKHLIISSVLVIPSIMTGDDLERIILSDARHGPSSALSPIYNRYGFQEVAETVLDYINNTWRG